jgi:hypothetical protein
VVIAGNLTFIIFLWLAAIVASAYLTYRRQNRRNKKLLNFFAWIKMQLQHPVWVGRNAQTGEVDMGGIILLGIGMVFLSIGFIFLKLTTDASTTLLTYEYSANTSITATTFTGYKAFVGLTPLLVLLGYETSAVITGFMGIQVMQGKSEAKASKGTTLLMALSIVFIAIGLIIEPITLDGWHQHCTETARASVPHSRDMLPS